MTRFDSTTFAVIGRKIAGSKEQGSSRLAWPPQDEMMCAAATGQHPDTRSVGRMEFKVRIVDPVQADEMVAAASPTRNTARTVFIVVNGFCGVLPSDGQRLARQDLITDVSETVSTTDVVNLQSGDKISKVPVVFCRLVPKNSVSGICHHASLGVPDASHLLLNDRWLDDGIFGAMGDQHRLSHLWQKVIIVERPREQSLADKRRNRNVIPQRPVAVFGC
jgi:hypothetical protein